jgi:glutamate decarboxylase
VGWVIWRQESDLPENMIFWVNYLGGNMKDIALNFSRPGGQIVCQYYNFLRLGREGYEKVHGACYDSTAFLAAEISAMGPFEIVFDGNRGRGIPAVSWKLKDGTDPGFTLFDLADRLRVRGWQVPAYTLPAHCENHAIQRILVRNGVSLDLCALLIDDMKSAIEHLGAHPAKVSLGKEEASGFHH